MPNQIYPTAKEKAIPKLRLAPETPRLRLAGSAPTEETSPGKYLIKCDTGWTTSRARSVTAILQFTIPDGKHAGTALRMWLQVSDGGGVVTARYAQHCSIALGRSATDDDPLDEPARIFGGRFFTGFVGYRKSERPGGGGRTSDDLALRKKDDKDYLKVHELLERVDI